MSRYRIQLKGCLVWSVSIALVVVLAKFARATGDTSWIPLAGFALGGAVGWPLAAAITFGLPPIGRGS